ncbi:MAG: tRNA (N6-threonylcarbamoyladenosine(37)-N6)-methyltransferase TrmO [Candidatus Helarchaeota archaeon]
MDPINMKPIGIIHSPYKNRSQAPFQGIYSKEQFELEIFKEFTDGLMDIERFSHIILLYYAHKSGSFHLRTTTPWDTIPHGIFTTCSPHRPNFILLSIVPLIERKSDTILLVTQLDALDGTPILDIKPYIPDLHVQADVQTGWMENKVKF